MSLGTSLPFRITPSGVTQASGTPKTIMNVEEILGVPTGKLPWRCAFGSRLTRLRHLNNTNGLQQLARVDVQDALQKWAPGISVTGVSVAPRSDGNRNVPDLTADIFLKDTTVPVSVTL
jgi:phage baseplate assembly protein W